jgi:predicted lipoprotein
MPSFERKGDSSMSTVAPSTKSSRRGVRIAIEVVLLLVLLAAMAMSTKVVKIGSGSDTQTKEFEPEAYGKKQFPKTQAAIEKRAVDAATLATAIAKDPDAAGKQYGIAGGGVGPEMSVKFTGVAGKEDSGVYEVKVPGLPDALLIRVQTGPAINGTDLRDATGDISFGQFTNQIDYQNAGYAINSAMKKEVLSKVDTAKLTGKTVAVVGVFQLINPNGWLVTPVKLDVK